MRMVLILHLMYCLVHVELRRPEPHRICFRKMSSAPEQMYRVYTVTINSSSGKRKMVTIHRNMVSAPEAIW